MQYAGFKIGTVLLESVLKHVCNTYDHRNLNIQYSRPIGVVTDL